MKILDFMNIYEFLPIHNLEFKASSKKTIKYTKGSINEAIEYKWRSRTIVAIDYEGHER